MKEYDIKITEVLEKTVQVQADTREPSPPKTGTILCTTWIPPKILRMFPSTPVKAGR